MRHITKSEIMSMDLDLAWKRFQSCVCFVEYELMPHMSVLKQKKRIDKTVERIVANVEWLVVCKERIQQLDPLFDDKGAVERLRLYVESLGKTLKIP